MQGLMKFHQGLFKILRKQNVTDERTDGRTNNVKTVYPPTNTACRGYNYDGLESPMLHTKFGENLSTGSGEEDI